MSIEINNLRITKLREYLIDVIEDITSSFNQFNINFLDKDALTFSLDKIPTEHEVEKWIMGIELHREVYSLRTRMNYSADEISNIENVGFFEIFEEEIRKNNDKKILPNIDGIQSVRCLNCGTMTNATTNTSEFDIQIQIEYRVGGNDETNSTIRL